jgi:hypothetical protein
LGVGALDDFLQDRAPADIDSESPSRGLQFSLRTLLLLVTVACVFFAFPRFMLGWIAFSAAILLFAGLFVLLMYLPVKLVTACFSSQADEPDCE